MIAAQPAGSLTTKRVFAAIILYCLAHYLIRLALSPVYSLDEAEQLLFAQSLDWGYRFRHPPLITWIYASAEAAGVLSREVFFAIKYSIMAAGFMAFHLAARRLLGDTSWAAAATASWATVYVIAWWPHVDLMHTVLLFSLLCASLHAGVLAATRGQWRDWLYFGATIGLGFLAKYVHAVFPLAFLLAAATLPTWRRRIDWPKAGAALVFAAAIIAPYGVWMATYGYSLPELAGDVVTQTDAGGAGGMPGPILGAASFGAASLEFLLLFIPLVVFVWPKVFSAQVRPPEDDDRRAMQGLLWRTTLIAVILTAAPIALAGATAFKSRWMHQALLAVPLLILARAQGLGPGGLRLKVWGGICVALIVAILIARPAVWLLKPGSGEGKLREYQPFEAFAGGLVSAGFEGGTVIARDYILAGNLAHFLPDGARVVDAGFPLHVFPEANGAGACVLVWRTEDDLAAASAYARAQMGVDPDDTLSQGGVTSALIAPAEGLARLNYRFVVPSDGCR